MDNLISISIEGTGIEELPPSIGNLVGLQELSMTSCLSLKELPESFDMLQNLRNLDIEGCPQLRSFLTKLRELGQSSHTFDNVQQLNLENCGLRDEDLPIIFSFFPRLVNLELSENDFVTLPSCTQEFPCLKFLHLDDCKQLQEVPGIPPNLQYINAQNCTSLTVGSSNLLLSQETFKAPKLEVMVPGARVPEWFDHSAKGEYMTFWVRQNFPAINLCFVLGMEGEMKEAISYEVRFYINGEEVYELEVSRSFSKMVTDHVWLYDLRTHPTIHWDSLDLYLVDEWNQLEISCEKIDGPPNVTVSWCGVHVCKQEVDMKNILFTDPDPDLSSSKDSEEIDADLDATSEESTNSIQDLQYCNRVDDNSCGFNKMESCETPNKQIEEWGKISEQKQNSEIARHTDIDQSDDKILLHPKTSDSVTEDSMASVCLGGTPKDYGSNTTVFDLLAKAQPNSQVTSFIETPNIQATTAIASWGKVTIGELPRVTSSIMALPANIDCLTNQTNLAMDDIEMEAFYASLEAETSILPLSNETTVVSELANRMPSEDTQNALETLQDFLTRDFSVLLRHDEYNAMKATLGYLTNVPAEDGMPLELRSLIIQVSREFAHWSWDYTNESKKIEATTAKLLKVDELEEGLEANKIHFREVMCFENELCNELAYLEERKKELEEQINAIKVRISASESARNMATDRKRDIFGEAKTLKVQRDELRKQVPHLRNEQELAKKIQANIRAEWSKLGEKFSRSLKSDL